jgi:hypothetical protein
MVIGKFVNVEVTILIKRGFRHGFGWNAPPSILEDGDEVCGTENVSEINDTRYTLPCAGPLNPPHPSIFIWSITNYNVVIHKCAGVICRMIAERKKEMDASDTEGPQTSHTIVELDENSVETHCPISPL